jgi:protein-tyrosine-phosphatase
MKIAFISTRNAVRSIMAEAIAKRVSKLALLAPEIYSAGVKPAESVPEEVLSLLQKKGYSTDNLYPKPVEAIPYEEIDILITLSPEARDMCPYSISHKRREHWVVEEPDSLKLEELEKTLLQIEKYMMDFFKIS